jgi:4-diphosphocytidyl-2-C-methyl-D-erythritol kinase
MQCPAKINLFLEITGQRADGYHRLATLFAKINLYDVLELETARSGVALEVVSDADASLSAGPDNLVWRAAEAFLKAFRVDGGVRLRLTKRIPMGAGLGGGSSDAAGTLAGMIKLFEIKLDAKKRSGLHRIAASLGADVPFFLHPAPFCLGTGIGDRLKPIKVLKSLPYMVLVYPGLHVSTVQAYKALAQPARPVVLTRLSHLDKLIRSLERGRPVEEWEGLLFNRLEEARLPVLAQVEQARKVLLQLGLRGARMSGSGSSVFAFAGSHAEAEAACKRLEGYPWKVFLTCCNG